MSKKNYRFETLALRWTTGRCYTIAWCSSIPNKLLCVQNTEHAANLFALKELGNIYTRLMISPQVFSNSGLLSLKAVQRLLLLPQELLQFSIP